MLTIDTSAVPHRAPAVREQPVEDELLLFTDLQGEGISLNPSAWAIWDLCDGRRNVGEIGNELSRLVGRPAQEVLPAVQDAVARLTEARVLAVATAETTRRAAAVDWSRIAEPQGDQYDALIARDLLTLRGTGPTGAPAGGRESTILEGKVALRACYPRQHITEGLVDAPFGHANIEQSVRYLELWPVAHRQFPLLVHSIHPLLYPDQPSDERFFLKASHCHSIETMPGTMWSTINCPLMLAESYVHELAHQKLFGLGLFKESCERLVANPHGEQYRSPVITDRPRPMTAVVHGVYAYAYVTELDLHVARARFESDAERHRRVLARVDTNVRRLQEGYAEIRAHLRTDAAGAAFFPPFFAWLDRLIAEGRALGDGSR
jgi:hypothetical protein